MAENDVLSDLVEALCDTTIDLKDNLLKKREQIQKIKSKCEQLQHKYIPALKQINTPTGISRIRFGTWNINSYNAKKHTGMLSKITGIDFLAFVDIKRKLPTFDGYSAIVKPTAETDRGAGRCGLMFLYKYRYQDCVVEIPCEDNDLLIIRINSRFVIVDENLGGDQLYHNSGNKDLFIFIVYWNKSNKRDVDAKVRRIDTNIRELRHNANTLLMGDFNAHTEEIVESAYLEPRLNCCATKKNMNGSGLLELCERTEHIILNGRCPGDLMGQLTYHQHQRTGHKSTIDYIVSDRELYDKVEYMYVHEHNRELSDHCLLEVSLLFRLGSMLKPRIKKEKGL